MLVVFFSRVSILISMMVLGRNRDICVRVAFAVDTMVVVLCFPFFGIGSFHFYKLTVAVMVEVTGKFIAMIISFLPFII